MYKQKFMLNNIYYNSEYQEKPQQLDINNTKIRVHKIKNAMLRTPAEIMPKSQNRIRQSFCTMNMYYSNVNENNIINSFKIIYF